MSTKIYQGFRCGTRDRSLAVARLESLGPRLREHAHRRELQWSITDAVHRVDARTLNVPHMSDALEAPAETSSSVSPWQASVNELRARQAEIKRTQHRDPEVDVEVSISLWQVAPNGEWLGYVSEDGSSHAYATVLAHPSMSACGYWNNTDRPSFLNERQWKKRATAWKKALGAYGCEPAAVLTFLPSPILDVHAARAWAPSLETRVRQWSLNQVRDAWFNEQGPIESSGPFDLSGFMRQHRRFTDLLRTDPVLQARLTQRQTDITARLIADEQDLLHALTSV